MKKILLISSLFISISVLIKAQIPADVLVACYLFNGDSLDQSSLGNHASFFHGVGFTTDRFDNPGYALHDEDFIPITVRKIVIE
jgi:hypothetical protein